MTETAEQQKVWFSQREAAAYAGVHEATVWRARKSGALKAGGVGRKPRIHITELDRWLTSGGPDQA